MEVKIAAAYIRVSDERQDEYSPDSQLKLIRDYAKKNGYFVPDEYVFFDDGISAKSVKRRTAFNNMIALAKEKEPPFDCIYVWKFSRFARNQEEAIVYKSMLKKNHVDVISISEPIIDGAFGTLIERIIEWMDEYYLINLSTEVKRGMLEKFSRGEIVVQAPQGYDTIDNQYIPNADAPLIRRIFEMYTSGMGQTQIARAINLEGYTTARGNLFENRTIDYIINNPVYIGKLRWSSGGRTASVGKYNDPAVLIVDGSHEPIIDLDTWNKAQEIYTAKKAKHRRHRQETKSDTAWMLKGLVTCSACGATLTLLSSKSPAAQCHQYCKGRCHVSHSITISRLNAAFIECLEESLKMDNLNIDYKSPKPTPSPADKSFDKLIALEERKLARVREAYESGIDSLEEYQQNKKRITEAIQRIEAERQASSPNTAETHAERVRALKSSIQDVLTSIKSPDLPESAKRDLICDVVSHIVFDRPNSTLSIYFLG